MKFSVTRRLALSSLLLRLLVFSVYAVSSVDLGTAGCFGVLAGSNVTNTGSSVITGNVGVWPGTAVVGFPPGIVGRTIPAVSNADTSFLSWIDSQDKKLGQWPDVAKSESAVEQFKEHLEQVRFETLASAQPPKQSRNSVGGVLVPACYRLERLAEDPLSTRSTQDGGNKAQQDPEPQVGCCCLLNTSGATPVWDCVGGTDGTTVSKKQCAKKAEDAGNVKHRWHPGKCADRD